MCDADPRGIDQRRANALIAAVTHTGLGCTCGEPDCPAAPPVTPRPRSRRLRRGRREIRRRGDRRARVRRRPILSRRGPRRSRRMCSAPDHADRTVGRHPGAGAHPRGPHPGESSAPEPRYTPSTAVCEFVRCRDLTCRFPGCDKPAQVCDVDHTVAYPVGPTHPSNLKCLCRFHHLLKTFWNGRAAGSDRQLPDGTVIWTSPTGHTYITYPGSLHLFPQLCKPTATLWPGDPPSSNPTASVAR